MMDDAPDETPGPARLPSPYDSCLLGATVGIHGPDLYVYSLRALIRFEMTRRDCSPDEARTAIAAEILMPVQREHGPLAPLFVNDELVKGEIEEDGPRIIVPKFGRN